VHFKDIRKDDLRICGSLLVSQPIGDHAVRFARIHVALLFATSGDALFLHHALDPIFPRFEQDRQFAMAHGIILFLPLFNRGGHRFIFPRLFAFAIQRSSCDAASARATWLLE
jgi:hypothetical protein